MKKALVIGGFGFIGSCIVNMLLENGWYVNILDLASNNQPKRENVSVHIGDVRDTDILEHALDNVEIVFYFASHTIPGKNPKYLDGEITYSLTGLNEVLMTMVKKNIRRIFYPSSGGTVYGEFCQEPAGENDSLKPVSAYGMGKVLCEEILEFYSRNHGIQVTILRIANVYGCPFYREKSQGVIDIFIQNILNGQSVTVWGDASSNIRDYIYIKDFCRAVHLLLENEIERFQIYNIASGTGHSLKEVLECVENIIEEKISVVYRQDGYTGVSKNVLNTNKISNKTGWKPEYTLFDGIYETIQLKKMESVKRT